MTQILKGGCLHDLYYYVLNESECHSNCKDFCSLDCETHQISDDASEISIDVENLLHLRKGPNIAP